MQHIVLPQAIKNVLPALGNEFITLLKETSVGAYIGVVELTKASDIIASRTYDYFFPASGLQVAHQRNKENRSRGEIAEPPEEGEVHEAYHVCKQRFFAVLYCICITIAGRSRRLCGFCFAESFHDNAGRQHAHDCKEKAGQSF